MCGTCGKYGGEAHKVCWWGNLRVRDHLKDVGLYGKIILKGILWKFAGDCRLDCSGSGQGQVVGCC